MKLPDLSPKLLIIGAIIVGVVAILAWIFISREVAGLVAGAGEGTLLGLAAQGKQKKKAGAKQAKGATASANEAGKEATEVLDKLGDKEGEAVGGKDADSNDAAAHKGGGGHTIIGILLACGIVVGSSGCAAIDWHKAVATNVAPPVPESVEEPAIVQGNVLDCPRYVLAADGTWHESAWFASGPTLELDVAGTMLPGYGRFNLIPTPITTMDGTIRPLGSLACTFVPVAPNVYGYFLKLHRAWGPRVAREQVWQEYAAAVTDSYGELQAGADLFVKGKTQEQRTVGLVVTGVVATVAAILGVKIGWDLRGLIAP